LCFVCFRFVFCLFFFFKTENWKSKIENRKSKKWVNSVFKKLTKIDSHCIKICGITLYVIIPTAPPTLHIPTLYLQTQIWIFFQGSEFKLFNTKKEFFVVVVVEQTQKTTFPGINLHTKDYKPTSLDISHLFICITRSAISTPNMMTNNETTHFFFFFFFFFFHQKKLILQIFNFNFFPLFFNFYITDLL